MTGILPPAPSEPTFELESIKEIDDHELTHDVAPELFTLIGSSSSLQSELHARNHGDVVKRYAASAAESGKNLLASKRLSDTDTYLVRHAGGNLLGLATDQTGLALRRQGLLLPAWFMRRVTANQPLHQGVRLPEHNVFAWASAQAARDYNPHFLYKALYERLAKLHPRVWTIEASGKNPDIHSGIQAAGFRRIGEPARYDELESPWIPPKSQLYIASTALVGSMDEPIARTTKEMWQQIREDEAMRRSASTVKN